MKRVRARASIAGRVQGVWFRESTRERASQLGLSGWVRNLPDGRVEALFEGERKAVDAALDFIREGPRLAQVLSAEIEDYENVANVSESGFLVTR